MNSKYEVSHQQNPKNRKNLGEIIPLDTPLSMQIELASACNFRCSYCLHSSPRINESGFKSGIMTYDLFVDVVNSIKKFPRQLEFISLQSRGESLLNKKLPEMIKYIKTQNVAKEIALNTNAVLLNPMLNAQIVESGLDSIRLSIQGLSNEQYLKVSGVTVDFDAIVNNIKNLYENKKSLDIYIKIINIGLTEEDRKNFLEIFAPICDRIYIENPVDAWIGANLEQKFSDNRYGFTPKKANVCPRIFFAMVVHFDGNVVACDYDWEEKYCLGSVRDLELVEIWNSKIFNDLRKMHLEGNGKNRDLCENCIVLNNCELDNVDDYACELIKYYK